MKTRNFTFYSLFILIVLGLTVSSCQKDDDTEDTSLASDNSIVQGIFDQAQSIADQASNGSLQTFIATGGEVSLLSACASISFDSTVSPKKITVDFGTSNCLCADGRYRRGKIIVRYTGFYRDSGTAITYTFDDYAVSDHIVSNTSTKVVTNKGKKSNGHPWFTIYESGSIIKPNNGGTITWASTREREWTAGYGTLLVWSDDQYLISGSASGQTASKTAYTMNITIPLHIKLDCHNIVAGAIDFMPLGKDTYIIDYGNGTCDNQATITYRNKTYNITLN